MKRSKAGITGAAVLASLVLAAAPGAGSASAAAAAPATVAAPATAPAAAPPPPQPDLVALLDGVTDFWVPDPDYPLHGEVVDPVVLATNDRQVSWINTHATPAQQFAALQDAQYGVSPDGYDQSITISTGLGSVLGPLYVEGRQSGALPLTSALLSSTDGSAGAFVSTEAAKEAYSFPRPFLPSQQGASEPGPCDPATVNASSLQANRVGKPYANAEGDLDIVQVAPQLDDTHEFTSDDVELDGDYEGLCTSGSFPSGHTTTAYQAGVTLATMLPELAPEILARASENGNDRLVLGVHSPLDIMGGRISGHAAIAALWSSPDFVANEILPATVELRSYLEQRCGGTIAACAAEGSPYTNDPYDGAVMPGGTAQIVTDRASGVAVYEERMTYAFAPPGETGLAPAVPAGAENLLLTTFPGLTDEQRASVIAQTEIDSGYALDTTPTGEGSWQRVDLAAATSATVQLNADGGVSVVSVGGAATVLPVPAPTPTPTPVPTGGPQPTTPGGPSLADTGLDTGAPVGWAAGALAAGVAAAVVAALGSRRRRAGAAASGPAADPSDRQGR
ncbi:phosphatase PAP2 family protein [Herbiconiux sp. A18JL235]|uniref:Phosphatase PAP2 family protein n=1 Tax=Herbiconiux sp. A18JL235 TaxID=3152363 RepID=A0AB39BJV7_9MICO